jgi:hypothetical protein
MDNQSFLYISAVVVLALIIMGIWWISRRGKRLLAEQNARLARSQPAQAKVIQIGKSVTQEENGIVVVKLRVEVAPSGKPAYQATTVWEIQQGSLSQIQPGQSVAVKVDADDTQIIYPNVGWAEFSKTYWQAWVKNKQKGHK